MRTYQNLCTLYYELDKPHAPREALTFYSEFAKRADGPIFEPMCGTGRFLVPLLEQGYDIEGADASRHMLGVCQDKCHNKNITAKLHQQFIQEMNFDRKFSLILIPSGSFGLLTDVTEAKRCLKILYDHLLPEGKLVFEVETMQALPTTFGQHHQSSIEIEPNHQSLSLDIISSYDHESQIVTTTCRYDMTINSVITDTEVEDIAVRYYQDHEMDEWLTEVGIFQFTRHKAYEPYSSDMNDGVVVYACTKTA